MLPVYAQCYPPHPSSPIHHETPLLYSFTCSFVHLTLSYTHIFLSYFYFITQVSTFILVFFSRFFISTLSPGCLVTFPYVHFSALSLLFVASFFFHSFTFPGIVFYHSLPPVLFLLLFFPLITSFLTFLTLRLYGEAWSNWRCD